jgi:hypothetical protein
MSLLSDTRRRGYGDEARSVHVETRFVVKVCKGQEVNWSGVVLKVTDTDSSSKDWRVDVNGRRHAAACGSLLAKNDVDEQSPSWKSRAEMRNRTRVCIFCGAKSRTLCHLAFDA